MVQLLSWVCWLIATKLKRVGLRTRKHRGFELVAGGAD